MYGPGTLAFSLRSGRRDAAQPLELVDGAEAARRGELAGDAVPAALVVRRRPEAPRGRVLELDPFEVAVEREVEVEPRLLAVGDHVEPGGDLVVHGRDHGVLLQLGDVVRAELVEVRRRVLEPARERIAADDGRPDHAAAASAPHSAAPIAPAS